MDVELRPNLLGNIIVTGGSSLLYGFTERLSNEVQALYPAPRSKITASGNVIERKFGSWIGGSILSSLGNFQQVSSLSHFLTSKTKNNRCGSRRRNTMNMELVWWKNDASEK